MCGICGYISKIRIKDEDLVAMRDMMIHRGPDDAGIETVTMKGYNIGLAHRRLAILDLSANGHQPMASIDGNITIVYNGEIYNYIELREQLRDYHFSSDTDTEVLLAAYQKWGERFIDKCNGMFSMAVVDKNNQKVHLYRDRMGQKPLYYYNGKDEFIFASELKPILKYPGIKLQINHDVISRYLVKQCIAAPDTIYKNIYKLEPGCMITLALDECINIDKKKYWDLYKIYSDVHDSFKGSYEDAKVELINNLEKSVKYRLVSDVPLGIMLSGGYDSTIMAFLAQRNKKDKIKTFSIGMKNAALDEARYARKIANYIGTDHYELYISDKEMMNMVQSIPIYYDEPFADSSQIASMIVSKLAREKVTVALTGDGGDELFAGYPIYTNQRIAQLLDPIGRGIKKCMYGRELYKKLPYSVRMIAENDDIKSKTQFNMKSKIDLARMMINCEYTLPEKYDESDIIVHDWRIKRMLLDSQTYLPDDIHCKMDRASMMNSLETRSPFMDYNVVELALALPERYKLKGQNGKRILKDIAWGEIPRELLDRPKAGFEVPIDDWMREELKEQLIEFSRKSYLIDQGIFNSIETQRIIDEYLNNEVNTKRGQRINTIIWAFFVFQMWYESYKGILI